MTATLFDPRICELGEGAFWHPERGQPFWFDIHGRRLLSRLDGQELEWRFDEKASAMGWIDRDRVLVATETALRCLDLSDGALTLVAPLEADRPDTRSNDGRADPMGGFWIGTMAHDAARAKAPSIAISGASCASCAAMSRSRMRSALRPMAGWPISPTPPPRPSGDRRWTKTAGPPPRPRCFWT